MESWFKHDVLANKTALIIGGSSESGPIICKTLIEHGANVAFTYHKNEIDAYEIEKKLIEIQHSKAYFFDLLNMSQVFKLIPKIEDDFGKIDILINLGGPPPIYKNLRNLIEEDFDRMINSFLKGYFFLSLEAGKRMESNDGGVIINISATSSLKYSHSVYGLAKACQTVMGKFLAYTFAPMVRVITIIPGLIDIKEIDKKLKDDRANASPLKRNVTPEEMAQLIIMVCSPAFASITGESIIADGGFYLLHP
ncbi:MAG: SDR family oxidoreductase [Caldisericia bacterium]|nr:SDR family oxidoreductase [Caldisericia bacterium]